MGVKDVVSFGGFLAKTAFNTVNPLHKDYERENGKLKLVKGEPQPHRVAIWVKRATPVVLATGSVAAGGIGALAFFNFIPIGFTGSLIILGGAAAGGVATGADVVALIITRVRSHKEIKKAKEEGQQRSSEGTVTKGKDSPRGGHGIKVDVMGSPESSKEGAPKDADKESDKDD